MHPMHEGSQLRNLHPEDRINIEHTNKLGLHEIGRRSLHLIVCQLFETFPVIENPV